MSSKYAANELMERYGLKQSLYPERSVQRPHVCVIPETQKGVRSFPGKVRRIFWVRADAEMERRAKHQLRS